jgi:hypothetical protein
VHIDGLGGDDAAVDARRERADKNINTITIEGYRDNEVAWNDFATRCGGSFRFAYRATLAWQFDYHIPLRVRRVSCFIGRKKIAQVAIGISRHRRVFAEGLALLPEHQTLWAAVMKAIFDHFGAGTYHYGSPWSLERSREQDLRWIHGVALISVLPITVFAIDFSRWASWEDYIRAISSNARRNARRAANDSVLIRCNSGMMALSDAHHLFRLSRDLCRRKNLKFSLTNKLLRFITRVYAMKHYHFVAVAYRSQRVLAVLSGISFGKNTYYIESGALKDNRGSSWLLMLDMIRQAYDRSPNGHFVTGFWRSDTEIVAKEGLEFFRHQCQSHPEETSEIIFRYAPSDVSLAP